MTATEARVLVALVGREGLYNAAPELKVRVKLADARVNQPTNWNPYNHTDYLIEPVAGEGRKWVSSHLVELDGDSAQEETAT